MTTSALERARERRELLALQIAEREVETHLNGSAHETDFELLELFVEADKDFRERLRESIAESQVAEIFAAMRSLGAPAAARFKS